MKTGIFRRGCSAYWRVQRATAPFRVQAGEREKRIDAIGRAGERVFEAATRGMYTTIVYTRRQ